MNLNNYIVRWCAFENILCKQYDISGNSRTFIKREPCMTRKLDRCEIPNDGDRCKLYNIKYLGRTGEETKIICAREDPCRDLDEYNCERNERLRCKKYESKRLGATTCISKSRIGYFQGDTMSLPLWNKIGVRHLKIIATVPYIQDIRELLKTGENTDYSHTIYCQIITHKKGGYRSQLKPDLYICFNIGEVYDMNILWKPRFTNYLNLLYREYIGKYRDDYDKVVFCGHSAGCVTALRLGYYMFINHNKFFNEKCIVIGSGPFCWLPPDNKGYTNLPNIKIFINSELYIDTFHTDPIIRNIVGRNQNPEYKNISSYSLYYPMTNIYNIFNGVGNMISDTVYQRIVYSPDEMKFSRYVNHDWEAYMLKILAVVRGGDKNKEGDKNIHRGGSSLPDWYRESLPEVKKEERELKPKTRNPYDEVIATIDQFKQYLLPYWVEKLPYPKQVDFIPEKTVYPSYQSGVVEWNNQKLWSKILNLMKSQYGIPKTRDMWSKRQIRKLKDFYLKYNPKKLVNGRFERILNFVGPMGAEEQIREVYGDHVPLSKNPFSPKKIIDLDPKPFEFILKKGTILFHSSPHKLPFHKIKFRPGFIFFGLSALISIWYAAENYSGAVKFSKKDFTSYLNIYRLENDIKVKYIEDDISNNQEASRFKTICEQSPCLHPQFAYHSYEQLATKRGPVELDFELTIPLDMVKKMEITPIAAYEIDVIKLLENTDKNIYEFDPLSAVNFYHNLL